MDKTSDTSSADVDRQIDEILRILYRDANLCGQGRGDHLPRRSLIIAEADKQLKQLLEQQTVAARIDELKQVSDTDKDVPLSLLLDSVQQRLQSLQTNLNNGKGE